MQSVERMIPFKKHIPWYPGEAKPVLPSQETTTFNDERAVKSASLIAAFTRDSANSQARRQTFNEIRSFCSDEDAAVVFSSIVNNILLIRREQFGHQEQPKLARYEELSERVNEFSDSAKFFNASLLFEPHTVRSEEDLALVGNNLMDIMQQRFIPGERNIFLMEEGSGIMNDQHTREIFNKAYMQQGNYMRALAQTLLAADNRVISRQSVNAKVEKLYAQTREADDPMMAYMFLSINVIDFMNQHGAGIVLQFEQSPPEARIELDVNVKDEDDYKNYVLTIVGNLRIRNQLITEQLKSIADAAKKDKVKTNVVLQMGTTHADIYDELPKTLQKKTTLHVNEQRVRVRTPNRLARKIIKGEDVSELEWQIGFAEKQMEQIK